MSFANPRALSALLLILALALVSLAYGRWLKSRFAAWIDPALWPRILPAYSPGVRMFRMISFNLGLVFLSLALARPQWGQHEERIEGRGMDILFLLDLSRSMLAEDTPPSRLARAQILIRNVLKNLADDRVGIVAFAGKAFLTVPLTNDFNYVNEMVETLDPSAITSQGTDLGDAIAVAIRAFERSGETPHKESRTVIVISDGEDFGGSAGQAAAKLKEFGANFFALSVGSAEGAPIPLRGPTGVLQTYKKDASQKPVLTRVNRELLEKTAQAGGGTHLELINPDDAAEALVKSLGSAKRDGASTRIEVVKVDRYQLFLSMALICFILHLSVGYRPPRSLPIAVILILLGSLPARTEAGNLDSFLKARKGEKSFGQKKFEEAADAYDQARKSDSGDPALDFNQGTALARSQKPENAIGLLEEASRKALIEGDFETAARSLYNEGVILNESNRRNDAYDRLTKSIELAKRSGLSDVEEKARKALAQSFSQKPKQSKDGGNGEGGGENQDPSQADSEPKKEPSQPRPEESGRKRQFQEGALSKDVAESIMNDLSDREKQLNQRRLSNRKAQENPHDKDW